MSTHPTPPMSRRKRKHTTSPSRYKPKEAPTTALALHGVIEDAHLKIKAQSQSSKRHSSTESHREQPITKEDSYRLKPVTKQDHKRIKNKYSVLFEESLNKH